jgi:hypothetical protein
MVLLSDTARIDSLSILPSSFVLKDESGIPVDSSLYKLIAPKAMIVVHPELVGKKVTVSYRVFPVNFAAEYYNKDVRMIEPDEKGYYNPFDITYSTEKVDIFDFGGLTRNGSISRGISFGNGQDVVVNSSLNLQLSGKLNNDMDILAAVTDNNIPVQPDGNTQQIQDFDKVFIQLSTKKAKLIAGDYELKKPGGYFMNFYKKAQGGTYTNSFAIENKDKTTSVMNLTLAAAISKGKYAKNTIAGSEGNQGPYKLTGAENETYIIILSGSEKVYIDGMLMVRGQDNDYVIDYNTGEVTFTGKRLITKDSRIIIEFQYSDKNYARSLLFVSDEFVTKKATFRINYYSEQDMKNQPVQQQLSDEEKMLLNSIGDSLQNAFVPNIDSVPFNNNEVLYKMVDTTANSILYDSVFVYSTNSDSAFFRLSFTNVGQGNGNYIQVQSAANGRVFEWIAPVSGVKQGTHEPIVLLITPKKKQMLTVSGDFVLSKRTKGGVEAAFSNSNKNLFSDKDKKNDAGFAVNTYLKNSMPLSKKDSLGLMLHTEISNEFVEKNFSPVERYRDAEFNRDWNLSDIKTARNENISSLKLNVIDKQKNFATYQLKMFVNSIDYSAFRHSSSIGYSKNGYKFTFTGSYLNTSDTAIKTKYIRTKADLSKKIGWMVLGMKGEQEDNRYKSKNIQGLGISSFAFTEWQAYAGNADSSKVKFTVFYKERVDKLPKVDMLLRSASAKNIGLTFDLLKNPNNTLSITGTYRKLIIDDSLLTTQKADESLLGLIEHGLRLYKGAITANTYFEIGSGREVKKEYSYLEVAQGQGVYAWTDYNSNGTKELNEFDVAVFQDQANYIRIYIPTNQYIKVYTNQLNESVMLNPSIVWGNKKGFKKLISRFTNQSTYRIDRKDTRKDIAKAFNPFITEVNDTNLISVNSSFRNSFYFNRNSSKIGADFIFTNSKSKILLVNGFESRTTQAQTINFRWNISSTITLTTKYIFGQKINSSEYFSIRDYKIGYSESEPMISWQPGKSFRISFLYNYTEKKNSLGSGNERCYNNKEGVEIKYTRVSKGSLLVKYNNISNNYSGTANTSISYEMLSGLKTGKNSTWSVSYQRNIAENLQLNLSYDGRKSENVKAIHVGSVQLRAYF